MLQSYLIKRVIINQPVLILQTLFVERDMSPLVICYYPLYIQNLNYLVLFHTQTENV